VFISKKPYLCEHIRLALRTRGTNTLCVELLEVLAQGRALCGRQGSTKSREIGQGLRFQTLLYSWMAISCETRE
jgi:hypothetical protein